MEKNLIEVLKIINEKLKENGIEYVIGGSVSLFLQGIKIKEVTDVDIMTTKENAFRINEIFKAFETKPVEYDEGKTMRSYWGQLKIKGIKVDVMGEFYERSAEEWIFR